MKSGDFGELIYTKYDPICKVGGLADKPVKKINTKNLIRGRKAARSKPFIRGRKAARSKPKR